MSEFETIRVGDLTALVLAGGLGRRLRPVIGDGQKVVAPVLGKPFIYYNLEKLSEAGVKHVVLCAGYLADDFEEALAPLDATMKITVLKEPQPLGTGGALRFGLSHVQGDTVLALNGDSYCDLSLEPFLRWHKNSGAKGSLTLCRVDDTRAYGQVEVSEDGQILSFREKSESREAGWVSAGVYLFDRQILEEIEVGRPMSLETDVFPSWLGRGLYGYKTDGEFLDIGTPERYAAAEEFLAERFGEPSTRNEP